MIFATVVGGGGGKEGTSTIIVTVDTGSTVTIQTGGKTRTVSEKNGEWVFKGCEPGLYTITAAKDTEVAVETLEIPDGDGQMMVYRVNLAYVKIYGIQRDITNPSPLWERTDDAVGFDAVASVGTVAGHSSFDTCYPWSGIHRETLDTGDVMVYIPAFWFKRWRDGNVEHIQIADKEADGFALHPAFNHSGVQTDSIYVGAYKTSSSKRSVTGVSPQANQTRATMRNNAKAKGGGWGLVDISTISAIQMLMMVEFADNNMQDKIGRGWCDGNSGALKLGSCDNVPGLTGRPAGTNGKTDIIWRGIEGLWANIWEWVDGFNCSNGTYYVSNDPSVYADNTATGYTALSYTGATNWSRSYITEVGLDTGENPHIMLPKVTSGGSESTYYTDCVWSSTGWRIFGLGGSWSVGSGCGLFASGLDGVSSGSSASIGSRLLYIPEV